MTCGILVAQSLQQLHHECAGRAARLVEGGDQCTGIRHMAVHSQEAIDHVVGILARLATAHYPVRRTSQVLYQHDAQRDRHGP